MLDVKAAIDAKHDYKIKMATKSSARACRNLKLRSPDECFGANLIRYEDDKVKEVKVWLTVTYIHFKGEEKPWKFENSQEMRMIAEINDLEGKRGMLKALRIIRGLFGTQEIELYVPRPGISYARTRSDEYRQRRKQWDSESKTRRANGQRVKKKWTSPTAIGLRSGVGKAHSFGEEVA